MREALADPLLLGDALPGESWAAWRAALIAASGRRSGKTRSMAVLSTYLACLCDWSDNLSLGERGLCLYLAPSERQALVAWRYTTAIVEHTPLLASLVLNKTSDTLSLKGGIDIEVAAA